MLQEVEVVRDTRRRHGEGGGDLAGGQVVFLEHLEDATAGRVAEGFEEKVQWIYN